ncbi:hypothetical protein Csa_010660 [Cucumis sativus]|uniref:Uncharacterized protein n=1 Tax=Cucumis sativus TaxID=3659 RepID=A0A0A0L591_CUCSA|nr:hypothetical protein Csa_010660 [Cucumis sativus]
MISAFDVKPSFKPRRLPRRRSTFRFRRTKKPLDSCERCGHSFTRSTCHLRPISSPLNVYALLPSQSSFSPSDCLKKFLCIGV